MHCQPPRPRRDSPNHEGDLKIGFCQHLQALPLGGALVQTPPPHPLQPQGTDPPQGQTPPRPLDFGMDYGNAVIACGTSPFPEQSPPAPLQGTRTPVSPRGVPHTQRRHHGTPSPHKPAAERGARGAPPIPKTPAMHRGSPGLAACPRALTAQPPPRQAQPTFRGTTGTHGGDTATKLPSLLHPPSGAPRCRQLPDPAEPSSLLPATCPGRKMKMRSAAQPSCRQSCG